MRPKPFQKCARRMVETVREISRHENSLWGWFRNLLLLAICSDSTCYEISINVNSRLSKLVERLLSSFLSWDQKKCELGAFQNLACFCCVPTTCPRNLTYANQQVTRTWVVFAMPRSPVCKTWNLWGTVTLALLKTFQQKLWKQPKKQRFLAIPYHPLSQPIFSWDPNHFRNVPGAW